MKYSQRNNPKRQSLMPRLEVQVKSMTATPELASLPGGTIEDLKKWLQDALVVEHFTIPPYLCALYSMKDGCNEIASRIIRSVAVEEMLHMVMVANILNAIGGAPDLRGKALIRGYPSPLPESNENYEVSLLKFSKEAINTFLRIERPAVQNAPPVHSKFPSIGQFYAAITAALIELEKEAGSGTIFTGDKSKQVTPEHYYGSGGKLVPVYCLDDALAAIEEIVGQGEGIDGTINDPDDNMFDDEVEYAHYFRFNEIFNEQYYQTGDKPNQPPSGPLLQVDWNAVYNMTPNPKMEKYKDNKYLHEKMKDCNRTYMKLLDSVHIACTGKPDEFIKSIHLMYQLKQQAVELMKIPTGDGNYTAGPSFEYVSDH